MARRLIEEGVTFVEVGLGNWDTHDNNFERSKTLAGQLDQPYAQLLRDLAERGLLESTLVIWMGEFGRTPRINPRGGRDHYPRAFSVALAGGGVKGGQVIGRTDAGGADVKDRPVGVADLFQTFCKSLKLDPNKENMSSIGRPIRVVDGGQPVDEVLCQLAWGNSLYPPG
jgi:arylsulfatase A-like enzyme